VPLPAPLVQSFEAFVPPVSVRSVTVESDVAFLARRHEGRIRLIGGDAVALAGAVDADVAVWSDPVTTSGRIELLPFLHEQAVSLTAHRFGNPDRELGELPV
jgi:RHH-type proline utilization regulon transcriptional repressor/proline dehydrogenase/delta 1-pyrroline-5-carboxylate dehydrogenase